MWYSASESFDVDNFLKDGLSFALEVKIHVDIIIKPSEFVSELNYKYQCHSLKELP